MEQHSNRLSAQVLVDLQAAMDLCNGLPHVDFPSALQSATPALATMRNTLVVSISTLQAQVDAVAKKLLLAAGDHREAESGALSAISSLQRDVS
jgi:hypothetical protein